MILRFIRTVPSTRMGLGLLALFFLIGVGVHRDYGTSFDEKISRTNGLVTAVHVGRQLGYDDEVLVQTFGKVPRLEDWKDRDYGALFEVVLVLTETSLGIQSPQEVYRLRHLLTFCAFSVGLVFFFLLARLTLERQGLALLGTLMLATTPKVFAHAFYNSKDIPFMAACIVAAYTLLRLLRKPTFTLAAVHGTTCAIAVCVRNPGTYLVAATCAMLLLELLSDRRRARWIPLLGVFLVSVAAMTYALWPYLWGAPIENFVSAFQQMSRFRWPGSVLFQGELIPATALPWFYIPVWIAITIPPLYTALFLVGACLAIKNLVSLPSFVRQPAHQREPALLFGLFLMPLLSVVLLHSVLYGSWRQLFFIYPFLILTALHGTRWILEECSPKHGKAIRVGVGVMMGLTLLSTIAFLVRNHPHQGAHLNLLAGARPGEQYEMDNYGASYLQGMQFLLDHQPEGRIRLAVNQRLARLNAKMLSRKERSRLEFVPLTQANYFISNFRRGHRSETEGMDPDAAPIKVFEVDGSPILGVYVMDPSRVERQ